MKRKAVLILGALGVLSAAAVVFVPKEKSPGMPEIYPNAGMVPSNFLRFYVQFSEPMKGLDAFFHLQLLDERGNLIEDAFREIEFWNLEYTRLMVYFHPAQGERRPGDLQERGPVLQEGGHYLLRVLPGMVSRTGKAVETGAQWSFQAGPADRDMPDLKRWKIEAGSKEIRIDCGEWMDWTGAKRFLVVLDEEGNGVPGGWRIDGKRLYFKPEQEMKNGEYRLQVDSLLEDLAGNNFRRTHENRNDLPVQDAQVVVRRFIVSDQ